MSASKNKKTAPNKSTIVRPPRKKVLREKKKKNKVTKKTVSKKSNKKNTTKKTAKKKVTKKLTKQNTTKTLYEQILERNNVKLTKRQKDIRDFIFRTFISRPYKTYLKEYSEGSERGLKNAAKIISDTTNKFAEYEIATELRKMREHKARDNELYEICDKIFEKSSPFGLFDAALTADPQCIIDENRVVTILQKIRSKKNAEKHLQQLKNEINKTNGKLTNYEYRLVTGKYSEYFTKDEKKKAKEAVNRKFKEDQDNVEKNTKKIWKSSNLEPLTMDILNERKKKENEIFEKNREKILNQVKNYLNNDKTSDNIKITDFNSLGDFFKEVENKVTKSYTVESDPDWFENFDPKEEDKKSKSKTGTFNPSTRDFEKKPPETVDPKDVQSNMEQMDLFPKVPEHPLKAEAEKADKQLNQFEEDIAKAVKEYLTAKRNFIVKKTVIEKAYKEVFGSSLDDVLKFNI